MANQNYKEVWQVVMDKLRNDYKSRGEEDEFTIWFNMKYIEDTVNTITVSVPSPFMLQMINSKGYFSVVENALQEILGQSNLKLNPIVINEKIFTESSNENKTDFVEEPVKKVEPEETEKKLNFDSDYFSDFPEIKKEEKTSKKHPQLYEEYCFESFIPGENSNFAYNASLAVAKNPGRQYNPILLYGGSGLGKTHLMQAIGNYIYNNNTENKKICYVSAESFTNEFILSTKEGKTNEFKNKYRNLDVLLLDDIHFLQNKDATQEELFYTFNALKEKNAQMVFTCDRPIKEIKNLASRLVSRLSNGLCIDVKTPNYETRCAILQKKAEQMGQSIDSEVIDYISKNVETNVRELEAALKQLIAYAEIIDQKPNLEMAKNQLKDIFTTTSAENISLDIIQKVIAEEYGITISELKGKKRDKKFTIPRQIAIYIAREITELSYIELGNEFGKDHTTIMHSYSNIADKVKIDPNLDSKIKLFIKQIKEYKN